MVNYTWLRKRNSDSAKTKQYKSNTINRLKELRKGLRDHFDNCGSQGNQNGKFIRIASWNIREFDSGNNGYRTNDTYLFIAEIISNFDLIAVQEVNQDTTALEKLIRLLGPNWDFIATDQAPHSGGGHQERFAYVFNQNTIKFKKIAGEITLSGSKRLLVKDSFDFVPDIGAKFNLPAGTTLQVPPKDQLITRKKGDKRVLDETTSTALPQGTHITLSKGFELAFQKGFELSDDKTIKLQEGLDQNYSEKVGFRLPVDQMIATNQQFARPPFFALFQAGWLKMALCSVHIYYGKEEEHSLGMAKRQREIQRICEALEHRAESENDTDADNFFFALGDFNIVGREHGTMKALESCGFSIPEQIQEIPEGSNVDRKKFYDQIAFWDGSANKDKQFFRDYTKIDITSAGIFDFFDYVYQLDKEDTYSDVMELCLKNTNKRRAAQGKKPRKNAWNYKTWRTHQMSDHLPMWMELRVDFSEDYLESLSGNES